MEQGDPALAGLPKPGEFVFYPKVGHCVYRGLTEDRAAPGKELVELEDLEEGSRILIPTERVSKLGLRPAGRNLEEIQAELSAEFEQPLEEEQKLEDLIEKLVSEGSPRALAKGLKRLHLLRQTTGLSREEEQTRRKIRSWLAAEVALSKDGTRAEAQALITRILQEAMNAHRRKEREEAKERRRQVKAQKAAEDAAPNEEGEGASPTAAYGASEDEGGAQGGQGEMIAAIADGTVTAEDPARIPLGEQGNREEVGDEAQKGVPEAAPEATEGNGEHATPVTEGAPGTTEEEAALSSPDASAADESPEHATPAGEPPTPATEDAPGTTEEEAAPSSPDASATADESPSDESAEPAESMTREPARELSPELSDDSTEGDTTSPKSS